MIPAETEDVVDEYFDNLLKAVPPRYLYWKWIEHAYIVLKDGNVGTCSAEDLTLGGG